MPTQEHSGIIRTRRDRNNPYAMVNKAPFEDERLSWEARGVLAYLLTKPDDWQVRINDLSGKAIGCGRDKLRRILKELEDAGYLTRERVHVSHGRFDWVSTVHETVQTQSTIDGFSGDGKKRTRKRNRPSTGLPSMAEPSTVNPSIYQGTESNNSSTNVEEREKRARRAAPAPKQTNMNSFNEAVQAYKELSGVKAIAPVIENAIVDTVTDIPHWRAVIPAWIGAGFNPKNTDGLLDWYLHPEKMERKNGTHKLERPSSDRRNGTGPARTAELDAYLKRLPDD